MNTHVDPQEPFSSEALARYVSGEADAPERARVEAWAAAHPENRRELDALMTIWDLGAEPSPAMDIDHAWGKLSHRIAQDAGGTRVLPLWRMGLRWAAAAAVLIGLFFVARSFTTPTTVLVAGLQGTSTVLQDSSQVMLSPNSRVKVKLGSTRRLELAGKAWFEVARDEQQPFIVQAGELQVTVLGTGFEVSAYDTSGTWSVRVRHGRVRVEADTQRLELIAGQRVDLDRRTGRLVRGSPVTTETWGERIVRFDDAPMSEVVSELQRIFHVRVDLSDEAIGRCRLTATFENEPIEQVIRVITGTFGLSAERRTSDHFILRGDGC